MRVKIARRAVRVGENGQVIIARAPARRPEEKPVYIGGGVITLILIVLLLILIF